MTDSWRREGVVVSLPARELRGIRFSGSVFDHAELLDADISHELRRAIFLIERTIADHGSVVKYLARPEIFTHGVSLAWLRETLGSIRDHVNVSDGSTIRVIPGMRNHVFFHALGRRADAEALSRLEHRAPELFTTLTSQINTARRLGVPARLHFPAPVELQAPAERDPHPAKFFRFYLNPSSIEDSVAATLSEIHNLPGAPTGRVTYVPLTEAACDDPAFSNALASLLARTFFDSSHQAILRLPVSADRGATTRELLASVLTRLRDARVLIPPVPTPNVFFAADDVSLDQLRAGSASIDIFAHDSFDFWRHPREFYGAFETMRVSVRHGRHNPAALANLLAALCGRKPDLLWPLPKDRARPS